MVFKLWLFRVLTFPCPLSSAARGNTRVGFGSSPCVLSSCLEQEQFRGWVVALRCGEEILCTPVGTESGLYRGFNMIKTSAEFCSEWNGGRLRCSRENSPRSSSRFSG